MPRTKPTPTRTSRTNSASATARTTTELEDVLTLAEAAAYLRIAEADVVRMVYGQGLPGRQIGSEWRFLKSAVQDWLSNPPPRSSKEALRAMAGAFKDDPFLEEIVREAYRQRGRPITETGE